MVAMIEPPVSSQTGNDKESEAIEAIEELIAEFGIRATITACLQSSAGDDFGKMGSNTTLRVIQVILRQIVFSKNAQLEAEIMALGTGVILEDEQSMRTVAAKWGISHQAVSKRVVAFADKWNLPPSQFMRSKKDRQTYSLTNRPRET